MMADKALTKQKSDEVSESHPKNLERCAIPLERLKSLVPGDRQAALSALGDKRRLGIYMMQSLSKCLDHFQGNEFRSCVNLADMLLDLVWEKLNTGHWKDVALEWRYAYTLCSVVKAYGECGLYNDDCHDVSRSTIMKTLDMGLLMGAPLWENVLAKMCGCIGQTTAPSKQLPSEPSDLKTVDNGCSCEGTDSGSHANADLEHSKSQQKPVHHRSESDTRDIPVKRQKIIDYPKIDESRTIPRISCPSIEHFQTEYWSQRKPVIIRDAIDFWPALTTRCWSLDYIRQVAGCRTVPIELGSKYTEDSWTQALMTIDSFIDKYIEHPADNTAMGYLAQHQLFEQVPELMRDFSIPAYCSVGADPDSDPDINAWFGPAGTVSPLHYDDKHNLLTQVMGEKYIRLHAPAYTEHLYPHSSHLLFNTSQVDVENVDVEQFPLFPEAPYTECVLREGEMLYMPPGHWHFVKSLAPSFSISFWWQEMEAEAEAEVVTGSS